MKKSNNRRNHKKRNREKAIEAASKKSLSKTESEKCNQEDSDKMFGKVGKAVDGLKNGLMNSSKKNNDSNSNQSQSVNNSQNNHNQFKTKDTSSVFQKDNQDEILKKLEEHNRHLTDEASDLTDQVLKISDELQKKMEYGGQSIQNEIKRFQENLKREQERHISQLNGFITNNARGLKEKIDDVGNNVTDNVNNNLDKKFKGINGTLKGINGTLRNLEDSTEQIQTVAADMNTVKNDIETTIGQQVKIKKTLDELQAVLTDKNLEMKKKLPASTHDEETIVKLGEYGKVIFEQLLLAARWYALKKEDLEGIEEERKSFQKQLVNEKNESFNQGKADGKKEVIKDLLEKYDDIVSLMDSQEGEMRVLADYLLNNGLSSIFEKGEVIDVTEENWKGFENQIEQLQVGKIEITQPGYVFYGEILSKAKCQVCKPETEEKADSSSIITNSEDSPETNPETNSENNSENVANINDDKIPAESTADSAEAVPESEEKEGE